MTTNWKELIASMISVKQDLKKVDVKALMSHHLPAGAASEEQICGVESLLGYSLDEGYRNFLKYANGWKGFYHTGDLFGTNELSGSPLMDYARDGLSYIEADVIDGSGFSREELLPIFATLDNIDLFVITTSSSHTPGVVIWFAGEEIERYSNFEEFFLAMIGYNQETVEYLEKEPQ